MKFSELLDDYLLARASLQLEFAKTSQDNEAIDYYEGLLKRCAQELDSMIPQQNGDCERVQ